MNDVLEERRTYSRERLRQFSETFLQNVPESERAELLGDTCLYAVGSGGRGEMSANSDLDLFIVTHKPEAKRIDEVRLQSAVIRAMKAQGLPDPSQDASFLKVHPASHLFQRLGLPMDDSENTFTVRMLLLLESSMLVGEEPYERLVNGAIDAYWKNAEAHGEDYLPIVLVNDIVRYWRILLLNYEAKTARKRRELASLNEPERAAASEKLEADRRQRSCKLRYSRALTCYSAVIYLLRIAAERTATTRDDVREMVRLTPTQRLENAESYYRSVNPEVGALFEPVMSRFVRFLKEFAEPEEAILARLADAEGRKQYTQPAEEFGQKLFELIQGVGADNRLYRYVVL